MVAAQQNSILCRFPAEILENIALEAVRFEFLGPPKALISLLCTCKSMHNALAFNQCYDLYTRIFETKFDIDAVRRRFGLKSVRLTNLAMQLKKYCTNLQKIRRGDIYSPDSYDILWTSFLMATENDGKNASQLEWAGLDTFVDRFVRGRLCEDIAQHNDWPAESIVDINALALWLMWFTTTRESLAAESLEQRQQTIDMVLQSGKLVERPSWDYYAEMDEEWRRLMDGELSAQVTTFYLKVVRLLKPLLGVYTPGILNGSWQGCKLVPIETACMGHMKTVRHPPAFGEGKPQVPLSMNVAPFIDVRDWTLLSWCPWAGTPRDVPLCRLMTMQLQHLCFPISTCHMQLLSFLP
ncbi:hypothetical protein PILCRDRAFT_181625 [Piloderma croceum F 1598]|uniref:F-box domain-containing protein n=1 Tax=Piloderma croceum (strain F 1598) TaxID=765440 RepID=A0A0C3G202_PILCF|nr:hypothetical protein PILCRDRAFT_181625 [Piloderma croceum F 1598]